MNIIICYYSKNVLKKLNIDKDKYVTIIGYCTSLLFNIFPPTAGQFYDLLFSRWFILKGDRNITKCSWEKNSESCNLDLGPKYHFLNSWCLFGLEVNILSNLPVFVGKAYRLQKPTLLIKNLENMMIIVKILSWRLVQDKLTITVCVFSKIIWVFWNSLLKYVCFSVFK